MGLKISEIAEKLGLELYCSEAAADPMIEKVAPIETATVGDLSFVANSKYAEYLQSSKVSAVIVPRQMPEVAVPQLVAAKPHLAFAKAAALFYQPDHGPQVVSEQAFIHPSAKLGEFITIYPYVYVGENAEIGDAAVLYPGVFVGSKAKVGKAAILHANVVIGERCQVGERTVIHGGTVIGADGFGFAPDKINIVKIPQTGTVVIGDDVELGALCTIDRATMGATTIGNGCKFDSKVHVGHNAEVGEHTMFSAHTAVGGSAKVGSWVVAGGQVGIAGHLEVGDGVQIGAKAGVITSVADKQTVMGFPAVPAMQWRRTQVHLKKLSDYEKRLSQLEKALSSRLEDS